VDVNRKHRCAFVLGDDHSVGDDSKAMQCDKNESRKEMSTRMWTYLRLVRLVLVRSATASSFAPVLPIKLLRRLSVRGHESQA
jgi:hypothetical protein